VAWVDSLGALRERRFRLLWIGQATSTLGDGLVPVALSFAVLEDLDGSATQLGLVLAAHSVPLVALVLIGGVWADRLPRQLLMLGSDVVRCAVQAVIALLLLTGTVELWSLISLVALYGTAEAFFQPAATGLVPSTVSAPRLQQANALLGLSRSASFAVGPALAGTIVALAGAGIAFAIDAGTFVISALSLAALRIPRVSRTSRRESFLAELAGGWRELVSHTWLWVIILWASTYLFAIAAPFQTLGPLVAKESLGGAAAWGLIAGSFGVGTVAGGALALRWKPARPMLVCSAMVFLAVPAIVLLALRAPAPAIAAAHALTGVAMGFFLAVWATTLQQHVPEEKLSRVSAWDWMGSLAFFPLGLVLVGPVAAGIGVSATLWISAAWCAASTVAVLLVPGVRNLRRREEPEPAVPETSPLAVEGLHG
jgi:MFS family permease